ncbi:hypothetical protein [Pseudoneobacillus sp. C159]
MKQIISERLTIKVIKNKPYLYTWWYDPTGVRNKNEKARKLRSQGVKSREAYASPSSKFKWLYLGPIDFFKEYSNSPTVLLKEIEIRFNREQNRILEKYIFQKDKIIEEIKSTYTLDSIQSRLEEEKNRVLNGLVNDEQFTEQAVRDIIKGYNKKYKEIRTLALQDRSSTEDIGKFAYYKEKYATDITDEVIMVELENQKLEELKELEVTFTIMENTFKEKRNYLPILQVVNEYVDAYNRRKEIEWYFMENKTKIKENIFQELVNNLNNIPTEIQLEEQFNKLMKEEMEKIKVYRAT